MKKPISLLLLAAALTGATGCRSASQKELIGAPVNSSAGAVIGTPPPRAVVYRMSGDASALNVPVQVDSEGNVVSYPDPRDLQGQEPVALSGGYFLDRRGVNSATRFTTYTYAEYSKLKTPPTPGQLRAAIIPGARVIDLRQLPVSASEAAAEPALAEAYLSR